jgi:hypothetical protein
VIHILLALFTLGASFVSVQFTCCTAAFSYQTTACYALMRGDSEAAAKANRKAKIATRLAWPILLVLPKWRAELAKVPA